MQALSHSWPVSPPQYTPVHTGGQILGSEVPTRPGRMEISHGQILQFQVKRLNEVGSGKILGNFLNLTTF